MQKTQMLETLAALVAPVGQRKACVSALRPIVWRVQAASGTQVKLPPETDHLVFVYKGSTKLVAQSVDGEDHVLAFQFTGDLVSVPTSGPYAYLLCALGDCELAVFDQDAVIEACSDVPGALTGLLSRATRALNLCRNSAVLLSRRSAGERVAGFIQQISKRMQADGDEEGMIQLPMSRREIGEALGLTVETVSREFTRLRNDGVIETRGRAGLRVLDQLTLADRAGLFAAAA